MYSNTQESLRTTGIRRPALRSEYRYTLMTIYMQRQTLLPFIIHDPMVLPAVRRTLAIKGGHFNSLFPI